jgi:hypothetical protein
MIKWKTHHCRAVDLPAGVRPDEEIDECRNEWYAVAENNVSPLEQTELLCVVFSKECQVNIARHGKGPQRIGGHKPAGQVRMDSFGRGCGMTYH